MEWGPGTQNIAGKEGEMKLPPYNPHAKCPKCSCRIVTAHHIALEGSDFYWLRQCAAPCRYTWKEASVG